jgi:hypothetical protein
MLMTARSNSCMHDNDWRLELSLSGLQSWIAQKSIGKTSVISMHASFLDGQNSTFVIE